MTKAGSVGVVSKRRRTDADPRERVRAIVEELHLAHGEAHLGNLEDPLCELVYISLTRQTHRQNASRSWAAIIEVGGLAALVDMPEEDLAELLQPSGFSRQKARWIKRSLEIVRDTMGALSLDAAGSWPDEELEHFLRSLPGINLKSAKCIMLYSMGRQVLPVDTHVRRIATRIGFVPEGLSESAIHRALEGVIPSEHRFSFHVNCVWHGRRICTALRPNCGSCTIREHCDLGRSERSAPRHPAADGAA